jgi:hypothetical protein
MIGGVDEGIDYLKSVGVGDKKFVLKCMGLDENRGDMTLFPLDKDKGLVGTRKVLEGLNTKITKDCPYVFQEYIPGPGECFYSPRSLSHMSLSLHSCLLYITTISMVLPDE